MSNLPPAEIPRGAIRFNTDSNKPELWDGSQWAEFQLSTPNLGQSSDTQPGARGVFSQGFNSPSSPYVTGRLDYINIVSTGDATTFVDGTGMYAQASFSSSTRGVSAGGDSPANRNILFITFASTGTQTDSGGDLSSNLLLYGTGVSNSTRGLICGGLTPTYKSEIEYVTIASLGNSQDFGHLTADKFGMGAVSNPTRGLLMGGHLNGSITDNIDMVTIPTLGNAQDFGTLTSTTAQGSGASNATRGVLFGGRYVGTRTKIEYVTIASLGNGTDFGDLSRTTTRDGGAVASSTRGVFAGGDQDSPSSLAEVNTIDYIQISTQGDAVDFGDLTVARNHIQGMSNAHGGL